MDPMSVQNHLRALQGYGQLGGSSEIRPVAPSATAEMRTAEGQTFGDLLTESINQVNQMQIETDEAMKRLASGESGNVHETLLAMQKAEISMRMLVEVRSKLVGAYQEIMRMQV
jgi:flagellar hook-basal body complex protein FliE